MQPDLNRQHEIPGEAELKAGQGELTKLVIHSPSGASAEIYLHGAHVTHFQPAGHKPVLWMSQSSLFEPNKPIRGGVPICFPWFGPKQGDPQAPAHGFARLRQWNLDSILKQDNGDVGATLSLKSDESTRKLWPSEFELRFVVTVGNALQMQLQVINRSNRPMQFEEALHTYLSVGDIHQVSVEGLKAGLQYIDKVGGVNLRQQVDPTIRFAGETDRVYLDTRSTCIVDDPSLSRRIEIAKSGSDATVVWNPWINKAKAMPDFRDNEWPGMVCVETVNAAKNAVQLAPGATHTMTATVRVI